MPETVISLCSKKKDRADKIRLSLLFYGIPACVMILIYLFSSPQSINNNTKTGILLIILLAILSFTKTMSAMSEVRIGIDGSFLIRRGIYRAWNQLRKPSKDSLVYYSSIKKGSTFVLSITLQNVVAISRFSFSDNFQNNISKTNLSFSDPKKSPFVMSDNIIELKTNAFKLINLRPIQAKLSKIPEQIEGAVIYFSVESYDTFFESLPSDLKKRCCAK